MFVLFYYLFTKLKNVMTIGENLQKSRKQLGLNQANMALSIDVADKSYWNYEKNITPIPSDVLVRLYETHNINPTFLITGEGPMFLPERSNTMQPKDNEKVLKNYEYFGHRLAELQDELGYLDKAMARIMGVDEKRYMRIKLGEEDATTEQLVRLASKVDVSLDWLIYGE